MNHEQVLQGLAQATTKAEHKRVINAATPAAAKALTSIAVELSRHGHGPTKDLAKAQVRLLQHPGSTHADFVMAAQDQHGEGFGSFLAGLGKAIFSPILAVGKAIFSHPAGQAAAKSLAGSAATAIAKRVGA